MRLRDMLFASVVRGRYRAVKMSLAATAWAALLFPQFFSCTSPLYDGDAAALEERYSVWQYLSVFSIFQDRLPAEGGTHTPEELFAMVDDYLGGFRYTDYVALPGGGGSGGTIVAPGEPIEELLLLGDSTLYFHIPDFRLEALASFRELLPYMALYPNIIIDVRHNGGGQISTVNNILNEFLPLGTEYIHYTFRNYDPQTRTGRTYSLKESTTNPRPALTGKNIVVLMNGLSASASEVLASALRDCADAYLIGGRSYGKGSGQTTIPRAGRRALRITSMTVSGISERTGNYHRVGIVPDETPPEYVEEAELVLRAYLDQRYPNLYEENPRLYNSVLESMVQQYCAIKILEPSFTLSGQETDDGVSAESELETLSAIRKSAGSKRQTAALMLSQAERAVRRAQESGPFFPDPLVITELDSLKLIWPDFFEYFP